MTSFAASGFLLLFVFIVVCVLVSFNLFTPYFVIVVTHSIVLCFIMFFFFMLVLFVYLCAHIYLNSKEWSYNSVYFLLKE